MIWKVTSEQWAMLIVATCGGLLFGALIIEHAFDMPPCPLCLMQRIWFFLAAVTAYAGIAHNPRWGIYPLLTFICCGIGGGFAIRQLWLQSLPADQVPACGPGLDYMFEVFPLSDVLIAMTQGTGDCAEPDIVAGLPLPVWALAGFVGIAAVSVLQLRARRV